MKTYAIINDWNKVLVSMMSHITVITHTDNIKNSIIVVPYDFEYIDDIHHSNKIILTWTNDSILKYKELYDRYYEKINVYYILDGTPFESVNNSFIIENAFLSENLHITEGNKIPSNNRNNTFFSLIGRADKARDELINLLYASDILNNGCVVYHCNGNISNNISAFLSTPMNGDPFEKNFDIPINSKIRYDDMPVSIYYSNYNIELVVETTTKAHYVTEKTIKPISARMPFLCVSSPSYLGYLHKLGFKTFSDVFDESYDEIVDDQLRMQAIVDILSSLIESGDIYNLYDATKEILMYNEDHLNWITNTHSSRMHKELHSIIKQIGKIDA